jgi:anthranilate phosphoribosyltransferase
MTDHSLQPALRKLAEGRDLTPQEAADAMCALMDGAATPAQIGALLMGLRIKGETVAEAAAFAQQMRARLVPVPAKRRPLLDTCGTGGSVCRVFNVSTAVAFVAAAAGHAVAKHGNRAMSGVCGSADVLEALGVRIDLSPTQCAACIDEVGIGFLFAPAHHPATRHVSGPRRELGVRTIFNLLGPLSNPAGATHQVMGVYAAPLCPLAAGALRELGSARALVVHGDIGIGEISTIGSTRVCEMIDGDIHDAMLTPTDLGLRGPEPNLADLAPAPTPAENAALLRAVLAGHDRDAATCARRDLVAVNAAAALRVLGAVATWPAAVEMAQEILASGAALTKLEQLAAFTCEMQQ